MFYTIYRTTNIINGKIYIGCHRTTDLDDGYLGSGKILLRAIEKYGKENFIKENLFIFDNKEDMFLKEAEIVNSDFVASDDTYNLKIGGLGGFDVINNSFELREKVNDALREIFKKLYKNQQWVEKRRMKLSKAHKESYKKGRISGFKNKKHTDETKEKIGKANSIHQSGSGNSQYGKKKTEQTKEKVRKKLKELPILVCPHCNKESSNKGVMNRWHFDNCKMKK